MIPATKSLKEEIEYEIETLEHYHEGQDPDRMEPEVADQFYSELDRIEELKKKLQQLK